MIARISRSKEGFADYLITGARKDSIYARDQKDKVIPLYGNLQTFKQTEKYLNKYKNYQSNYIHITLSFSKEDMDKLNEIEDVEKRDELFKAKYKRDKYRNDSYWKNSSKQQHRRI